MTRTKGRHPRPRNEVVHLEDLAPRKEILGGTGKAVFGQATTPQPSTSAEGPPLPRNTRTRKPLK